MNLEQEREWPYGLNRAFVTGFSQCRRIEEFRHPIIEPEEGIEPSIPFFLLGENGSDDDIDCKMEKGELHIYTLRIETGRKEHRPKKKVTKRRRLSIWVNVVPHGGFAKEKNAATPTAESYTG